MKNLKVKELDIECDSNLVVLNKTDIKELKIELGTRILVRSKNKNVLTSFSGTTSLIAKREIGVTKKLIERLGITEGDTVEVLIGKKPNSFKFIRKKILGESLNQMEMTEIIKDIVANNLTLTELTAFVLTQYFRDLQVDEIEYLTKAMAETGITIDFDEPVYDKHSIGGVPGNKVSLLIVPIIASTGLLIPKTSSRAITSPAGTADTFEVLAPVEFSAEEIKEIVKKVRGCLVWGGTLNIAPADDILIDKVEYPLKIDPQSQMLASILSKKYAVGVDNLVLDVPIGKGAKVKNKEEAMTLSRRFVELGERLNMRIEVGLTYGDQPIGHALGPALEAKEALEALNGKKTSTSLIEKSTSLAGILLEMAGKAPRGAGQALAMEILNSGKALSKMKEIIENQGGDPNIKPEDIPLGEYSEVIKAPISGYIVEVSNKVLNAVAHAAGAPEDKGAGLVIYKKRGGYVKKNEPILKIYAERSTKLDEALLLAHKLNPLTIEGMLLKRISHFY
ncbi:MAG: AMP phosphorylase [Candidatus Odinarchaeia archaeon]